MSEPVKHFYVHIPFCPSKCSYCAFVTHVGSLKLVPRYLDALEAEFSLLSARHPGGPLDTIYFGGGTPSMLAPSEIRRLVDAIGARLGVERGAEITLEAHPDTVDDSALVGYRIAGATRLSMGAESLQAAELRRLGRTHEPNRVADVMRWARQADFQSIGLDLMYGVPGQTPASWEASVRGALDLEPDHLSLYPLSIEPRTVFARRVREGELTIPEDESVTDMYALACELLAAAGFEHYEVANWARPGHQCRHNLAYWRNREFYGAGVGAHGYLHPARYENLRQTKRYIETVLAGADPVAHAESIDAATHTAETIMLGMRLLREGLDLRNLSAAPERSEAIDRLAAAGLIRITGHRVLVDERAALVAHEAIAELM
jgi:oxygen-independent coproporphyrinogen-3 oxidase